MNGKLLLSTKQEKLAGIILILAMLALPTSAVVASNPGIQNGNRQLMNGPQGIPTWAPVLDPEFSKWDNAPVTYDPIKGAVEQGRFPDCKTCYPKHTDYYKPVDPPGWPESTTVKTITTWPSAEVTECSGVLVDPFAVLTAAHCVFTHIDEYCDAQDSCWAADLKIFIHYGTGQEQESAYTQILTWTAWTQNYDFNYDLAGIKLDKALGDAVGWLGFGYNNDDPFFTNKAFRYTNYVIDTLSTTPDFLFTNLKEHQLFSNGPSEYGQAGAGAHSNEYFHIVFSALSHHREIDGETKTGHTRITPDKFTALRDWISGTIKQQNFRTYLPLFSD